VPDCDSAQAFSFLVVGKRLWAALGWTRSSYVLMSVFVAVVFLIVVVWWPLAEEYLAYIDPSQPLWKQLDWLLIGIFAVMSVLVMAGAELKADALVVFVGLLGGLVIESWGTQTSLWTYYTLERPPLWIIPAWPVASLAIDRLVRLLYSLPLVGGGPRWGWVWTVLYWLIFPAFYALMLAFVWPTLDKSFTWLSLVLCALLIATSSDRRLAVLTFVAGTALGYWLELWGTTRACWIYYTQQTPPLFAVLAHGLAAVAFWRTGLLVKQLPRVLRVSHRPA
jgi:hypothetical protein